MSRRPDPSDRTHGRRPSRPSIRTLGSNAGPDDEEGAPLVPDLRGRGTPAAGEAAARRPRRPDPFELDLMEDAE